MWVSGDACRRRAARARHYRARRRRRHRRNEQIAPLAPTATGEMRAVRCTRGAWSAWGAWCTWCTWCALAGARELDPAACAERFDVQRDKIIRTEESREMGARYLSELDVGARAECRRLCCETDACDVFVFEEKSPGSCYLFACGPPEDFRCKFTAHGNFSSGVLALGRRQAERQDRDRERELAGLRIQPSSTASTMPAARSSAAPHEPHEPHAPHEPPPPPPPTTPRCSRYQFACRAGGECIAVYNACDGVRQCADGSDEAPELGCPPPAAPRRAEPPPPPHAAPTAPPPTPPTAPPPPHAPHRLQYQIQLQESAEEGSGAARAPQRADVPVEGPELWPHRLAQAQPQRRYNAASGGSAGGSHIFSHKGGLLQDGVFEAPPWPPRAWPPPPPPPPPAGEGAQAERGWGGYGRLDWPDVEPRRAWPVPPPRPEPEIPLYMPSKTMPEMPMSYSGQQQTLRDGPKKGFELVAALPAPPAPPAPPARPGEQQPPLAENTTKKKALKDHVPAPPGSTPGGAGAAAALAARGWPPDEHDGLSEHPPAAVLLLVLGTLLTAALGALLACRARVARRRRRAHPRLALDADYLVNGMYL